MKTLSSKFISVNYDADTDTVYSAWKSSTEDATWDDIKDGFVNYFLKLIKENKPKYVIVDEREMRRAFNPDEQNWLDKNSAPIVIEAGVKKVAIMISKDGFVEMATETMMQDEVSQGLNSKFFDDIEKAKAWFKE